MPTTLDEVLVWPEFGRCPPSRVARQRAIYAALGDLMRDRVHALTIKAIAPGE